MEWWQTILKTLVESVSVIAVAAFFGKKLFEQYLNKRIETYKGELKRETDLAIAEARHKYEKAQFRFTKLHEIRLEVAKEMVSRLVDLQVLFKKKLIVTAPEIISQDKDETIWEALHEKLSLFEVYYIKHRMFLPPEAVEKVEEFLLLLKDTNNINLNASYYITSGQEELWNQGVQEKTELIKKVNVSIPRAIQEVEQSIRAMMGWSIY